MHHNYEHDIIYRTLFLFFSNYENDSIYTNKSGHSRVVHEGSINLQTMSDVNRIQAFAERQIITK